MGVIEAAQTVSDKGAVDACQGELVGDDADCGKIEEVVGGIPRVGQEESEDKGEAGAGANERVKNDVCGGEGFTGLTCLRR